MRHHRLMKSHKICRSRDIDHAAPAATIERLQLERLASAILSKQPEDLEALFECNPALMREWIEAFRRERNAAEAEARYWSAAVAVLATAAPPARLQAAE